MFDSNWNKSMPFSTAFKFFLFCTCVLLAKTALADTTDYSQYVVPNWGNMLRTMVRFNALNLNDQLLIDEYAAVTDCDIYTAFHKDDFKWNDVRKAILKSVDMNIATFPQKYNFDIAMKLDHYDFSTKIFRLAATSTIENVNTFVLFNVVGDSCPEMTAEYIPRTFRAVLDTPFYFDGLPLSEEDAHNLLKQMEKDNNPDRIIFARFYVRVTYVDPLRKLTSYGLSHDLKTVYRQQNAPNITTVRFDARLDGINFYSDPDHTHLIYQVQP